MIHRAVLAVLVAVALLAVAFPALDDARTATTADRLDATATELDRTAAALADGSSAVNDPDLAARTTVSVRVPTGLAATPVERAGIGRAGALFEEVGEPAGESVGEPAREPAREAGGGDGGDGEQTVLGYRLRGESPRVVALDAVPVPMTTAGEGPVTLRPGGVTRLELRLVRDAAGEPTVRVERVA